MMKTPPSTTKVRAMPSLSKSLVPQRINTIFDQADDQFKFLRKRKVRFGSTRIVGSVASRSCISAEDYQKIWYVPEELDAIKNEIRAICNRIRNNLDIERPHKHETRGLEQRLFENRSRNKALTIWGTLQAQERNKNADFIACIARKCSLSAKELAITEARRDYCEIYDPDNVGSLMPKINSIQAKPFPMKLKRKCRIRDLDDRNVRHRQNPST